MSHALIIDRREAQAIRRLLEKNGLLDRRRRVKMISESKIAIPLTVTALSWQQIHLWNREGQCQVETMDLPLSKRAMIETPYTKLKKKVSELLLQRGRVMSPELLLELPERWEKHGDLILVPGTSFVSPTWCEIGDVLWKTVCQCLEGSRLARKSSVSTDGFRTPQVSLLLGEDGWVEQVDNNIRYTYDVTRCMFSAGNISEKLRVASFNCSGQTVLDLYAGIGYFTLPYLVHANASRVIACEWNPAAVQALQRSLHLNNVAHRCLVLHGDNRQVCPRNVADRVNLGLIPSSTPGWSVACAALRASTGGVLHIHHNVESATDTRVSAARGGQCGGMGLEGECETNEGPHQVEGPISCNRTVRPTWRPWAWGVCEEIHALLCSHHGGSWIVRIMHMEHVKSYAPHVDHLVLDLSCSPIK